MSPYRTPDKPAPQRPQPWDPCSVCARAGWMRGCVKTCAIEEYETEPTPDPARRANSASMRG